MSCRRLGRLAAACLTFLALASGSFALATVPGQAATSAGLGVYRGAAAPNAVSDFGAWLGRRPDYALDYFAGDTWAEIVGPDWLLAIWEGTPYEDAYSDR